MVTLKDLSIVCVYLFPLSSVIPITLKNIKKRILEKKGAFLY